MTAADRQIHQQLFRFLGVGLVSFGADIATMSLLLYGFGFAGTSAGLISSRCLAWGVAIVLAFGLNARVTFGASIKHSRFLNYVFIQAIGAVINLGTYSALVLLGPFADQPLVALVAGSAAATANNFLLVRKFVYRFHPSLDDPDE